MYFGSCVRMGMRGWGLQDGNVGEVWGLQERRASQSRGREVNPATSTRTEHRRM